MTVHSYTPALLELRTAHEQSLEQLRHNLNSALELERQSLHTRHQEEVGTLRRELGEKEARATQLASRLADALAAADEKKRGLGEVESEIERLKEEGREMRERKKAARREATQLKVCIHFQAVYTMRSDGMFVTGLAREDEV